MWTAVRSCAYLGTAERTSIRILVRSSSSMYIYLDSIFS
jgi:hypothetical protein